jgi:hypothetical protein
LSKYKKSPNPAVSGLGRSGIALQHDQGDQPRMLEAEVSLPCPSPAELAENDTLIAKAAMSAFTPCRAASALTESGKSQPHKDTPHDACGFD